MPMHLQLLPTFEVDQIVLHNVSRVNQIVNSIELNRTFALTLQVNGPNYPSQLQPCYIKLNHVFASKC